MSKSYKKWSAAEKLEIINYSKLHGAAKASLSFNVPTNSINNWIAAFEKHGEAGLNRSVKSDQELAEIKKLKKENLQLKNLLAKQELQLRIKEALLKKSK